MSQRWDGDPDPEGYHIRWNHFHLPQGLGTDMPFSEQRIHQAIHLGEFVPYFQPLVDLRVGSIHGFEILARWLHPDIGLVPPNKFIHLVERYGLINQLSTSLLTHAL